MDGPERTRRRRSTPIEEPTAAIRRRRADHEISITDGDAAGPFEPQIPSDLPRTGEAENTRLQDRSLEALAERFHSTPALLQRLNPGATFAAGEEITVPNVDPMLLPALAAEDRGQARPTAGSPRTRAKPERRGERPGRSGQRRRIAEARRRRHVSKSTSALTVTDAAGKILMYAPVTTGSEHDPLPIGEWKVNGVAFNPPFRYNPELFWDADPTHTRR